MEGLVCCVILMKKGCYWDYVFFQFYCIGCINSYGDLEFDIKIDLKNVKICLNIDKIL